MANKKNEIGNANSSVSVQKRMADMFTENRKGYGPRENYKEVIDYLDSGPEKQLEKYYLIIDEDDRRFADLEPAF
jgi:hypothetical protein